MTKAMESNVSGNKGRNSKCVRFNNQRGDDFKLYAPFYTDTEKKIFHCIIKGYESISRGLHESEGFKKFPELKDVMKELPSLKSLPADFGIQSLKEILKNLATEQAKKGAEIYERNQATTKHSSVPVDEGCGSGNQLDNPEGRPPPFSVQQLKDMLLSELERQASSYPELILQVVQELLGILLSKSSSNSELSLLLQVVKTCLPDCLNAIQLKESLGVDSRSSPVQSPEGTQAEGGGWDASHPQDRGEDVVGATDGLSDVDTSLKDVSRLTGRKRANEGDVYPLVYNGDEGIVLQQPTKRLMENSVPPYPLGSQLEGSGIHGGGENVRLPFPQILDELGEKQPRLFDPVDGGQQHEHDLLAHEGDDNQSNHPDNMEVDASIATYHDSADLLVNARSWPSGSDLEELRVQQFHGTRAEGVECNASNPQSNEVSWEDMVTAMKDGNMDGLSVVSTSLEGVSSSTGRNRASLGDGFQKLFATDGSISVESSSFDREDFDLRKMKECEQDAEDLLNSYYMPNPEGGVAEGFNSFNTIPNLFIPCT
jgi:hypothetical protein